MVEASILLLTKNEAHNLGGCLESIYAQKSVPAFEVVVIDSGSTDRTVEVARRFPVRLSSIPPGTFHHARTRNLAAGIARGRYLIYLAADACPTSPEWLSALLANFQDASVGAVYGRQLPKPGATNERRLILDTVYTDQRIVKEPGKKEGPGYRYYHFSTVNAAIRRDVWEATRFPEDFPVFEDVGIAKRILDSGWKIVYEPGAVVYHSHNHTVRGLFRRYFDAGVVWEHWDFWDGGTHAAMIHEGWRLLRRRLSGEGGNGQGEPLATSIARDLAKYAGLVLGRHERFLPRAVKKRFSAFGLFD